jgi:hypothetical protein
MPVHLRRLLAAFAPALAAVAVLFIQPTTVHAMPATRTRFFAPGPQQQLEAAIRADDAFAVDRQLSGGAQVNARGVHDVTPLMIAVDAQSPHAVAALLRAGADPNMTAADQAGPVHLAVESQLTTPNGRAILAMVMKSGGDPNTLRPDGDPVIVRFAYDHDMDGLRWFKALGANLDIRGRSGRPIISDLAYGQNWDSVATLIELGARYDYEDTVYPLSKALRSTYGSSPDSVLYRYKLKVWQTLRDHGIALTPLEQARPPPAK